MTQFAFLFPGQGSQTVGMLSDFADVALVRDTFTEASDALGYDMWQLCQEGPEDKLGQTEYTQPAMLTADIALWRYWLAQGGATPSYVAGHSLGEYSALVAAEVIAFADAVKLVALRGRYMQEAVPEGVGAMGAVIALDDEAIIKACESVSEIGRVVPANFNSIGQTVISGDKAAVEAALAAAKEAGAKIAKLLPVSVPSHSPLMQPAAERLAESMSVVSGTPVIPVLHNVTVDVCKDPVQIQANLLQQLTDSVRWVQTIQALVAKGITLGVECGPGKVLAGLNKRVDKSFVTKTTATAEQFADALAAIGETA